MEKTKSKYYDEIKLRPGVTQEQQKATEFFNRYQEDQKIAEQQHWDFKSKTHDSTWADASVCLMLTAHAVELFLKGKLIAIGRQNIWEAKGNRHRAHDIEYLYEHYIENYKKENTKFHCPLQTEYLGFSEEETKELKQKNRRKPSVTYRYPF